MSARLAIALLTLVALAPLVHAQGPARMDGAVHVAWGFERMTEDPPSPTTLGARPGPSACHMLGVWNRLAEPLRAVTLTLHPSEPVELRLEVHADDGPRAFGYWPEVPTREARPACLTVHPREGVSTWDTLAVVRFELPNGTEGVAQTSLAGIVEEPRAVPVLAPLALVAFALAALTRR